MTSKADEMAQAILNDMRKATNCVRDSLCAEHTLPIIKRHLKSYAKEKVEEERKRSEYLELELQRQTYRGNSVGYIYDKMLAYQGQVLPLVNALKEIGFDYSNSGANNKEREKALMEWAIQTSESIRERGKESHDSNK